MAGSSVSPAAGSSRLPISRVVLVALLSSGFLTGCGTSTEIDRPPTYVGKITSARLDDVYLAAPGGRRVPFREVFEGFEPQTGIVTTPLPFSKISVSDIVYAAARPVAQYYDSNANDNGYLEGPELLVLYIRESAIGLGHAVDYVGVNPRFDALATSPGDTGGLVEFVERSKPAMTEEARKLFDDIERIGLDQRQHSGGGARGSGGSGAN